MSRATTRSNIAVALSTVPPVRGFESRPDALTEYAAWPQWGGSSYAGGHAYDNRWNILIVLPDDDRTADHFVDEYQDAILHALRPIMFVEEIQPAKIETDAGSMYGVLFTGKE